MTKQSFARRIAGTAVAVATLALTGCGMFMPVPDDLDYSLSRPSEAGAFRVSYKSETTPPPVSRLHSWTLHVETPDGKPVDGATIKVDGDMPQHLHGLPTRPAVTQALGNGDYLVEGIKFQMGGWWQMYFDITAADQSDKVTFNLKL